MKPIIFFAILFLSFNVQAQSACDSRTDAILQGSSGDTIRELVRMNEEKVKSIGLARLDEFNKGFRISIISARRLLLEQLCNTKEFAKLNAVDKIPLKAAPEADPQCSSKNPKSADSIGPNWGSQIVGNPDAIVKTYMRLRTLIACQNEFAKLAGYKSEAIPAYQLTSKGNVYSIVRLDDQDPPVRCAEPDKSIKITVGMACLFKKIGFWNGLNASFTPPPPAEELPEIPKSEGVTQTVNATH